jgi:hypothetical protein
MFGKVYLHRYDLPIPYSIYIRFDFSALPVNICQHDRRFNALTASLNQTHFNVRLKTV